MENGYSEVARILCEGMSEITLTDAIRRLMLVQTATPFEVRVREDDLQEFARRVVTYNPTETEPENAYSPADRR